VIPSALLTPQPRFRSNPADSETTSGSTVLYSLRKRSVADSPNDSTFIRQYLSTSCPCDIKPPRRISMAVDPRYDNPITLIGSSVVRRSKRLAVRYAKVPGLRILVRHDRCTGCGACVRKGFCRFGAISIKNRKAVISDRACRRCSRCTHLCPRDALSIEVRPPAVLRNALKRVDQEIGRHI
jgi:ferredoxin